jgi:hypothetical protein
VGGDVRKEGEDGPLPGRQLAHVRHGPKATATRVRTKP